MLDIVNLYAATEGVRVMLKPLSPKSQEYRDDEAELRRFIDLIEAGRGAREEACSSGAEAQKLGFFPLTRFIGYLERGKYPHPVLIEYFAEVFSRLVAGVPSDMAFGISRPKERPREDDNHDARLTKFKAGGMVYSLVANIGKTSPHEKYGHVRTVTAAIEEAAQTYNLSIRVVERCYKDFKICYQGHPGRQRRT